MKILHIGKYFPPYAGGIENFMATLVKQQAGAGHEVVALVHSHDRSLAATTTWHGCSIRRVTSYGQLAYAPIAPDFYRQLTQLAETERPDVIHIHMPNASAFWLLASSKLKNVPWVVHWHSDVLGASPDWRIKLLYPVYQPFEQALLKHAKRIIVTSPQYLATSSPLRPWQDKCHVVPLTTEASSAGSVSNLPAAHPESSNQPLKLIMVGRLTYYKGHEYLLRALSLVTDKVSLDIIGGGDLLARLMNISAELNLTDNVRFHGQVTDEQLATLLTEADLLCLPSIERTEAFGLVLLEAAALSCPALVTNVEGSGMTHVVDHNQTGLVAEPRDVNSLAEQISYAANNPKQLKQMGVAAQNKFKQTFSPSAVFSQINELYEQIELESLSAN